jgi:hypothetical protein
VRPWRARLAAYRASPNASKNDQIEFKIVFIGKIPCGS